MGTVDKERTTRAANTHLSEPEALPHGSRANREDTPRHVPHQALDLSPSRFNMECSTNMANYIYRVSRKEKGPEPFEAQPQGLSGLAHHLCLSKAKATPRDQSNRCKQSPNLDHSPEVSGPTSHQVDAASLNHQTLTVVQQNMAPSRRDFSAKDRAEYVTTVDTVSTTPRTDINLQAPTSHSQATANKSSFLAEQLTSGCLEYDGSLLSPQSGVAFEVQSSEEHFPVASTPETTPSSSSDDFVLIDDFQELSLQNTPFRTHGNGRGSSSSDKRNCSDSSPANFSQALTGSAGNPASEGHYAQQEDEKDPDDEGNSPKKGRHIDSHSCDGKETKLFACPFARAYPQRHRNCFTFTLRSMGAVKQHIGRAHLRPDHYCAKCYMQFSSRDEADAHTRQETCQQRFDCPFETSVHRDDCDKAIKKKVPKLQLDKAWFTMYANLFPGSRLPNSAYIELEDTLVSMYDLAQIFSLSPGLRTEAQNVLDFPKSGMSDTIMAVLRGALRESDLHPAPAAPAAPTHASNQLSASFRPTYSPIPETSVRPQYTQPLEGEQQQPFNGTYDTTPYFCQVPNPFVQGLPFTGTGLLPANFGSMPATAYNFGQTQYSEQPNNQNLMPISSFDYQQYFSGQPSNFHESQNPSLSWQ